LRIWGGSPALHVSGNDTHITNVDAGNSYGVGAVTTTGSNFYNHGKFDHAPTVTTPLTALPYPARQNTTGYIIGDVVIASSYALVCKTAGTSGGSTPTLKNYGIDITDGSVTWELLAPDDYRGFAVLTGALENRFLQTDFTGSGYAHSYSVDAVYAFTELTDCVFNSRVTLTNGRWTVIKGCVLGGPIAIASGMTHPVHISGCVSTGSVAITVAANKDDFHIVNNDLSGGTITVAAGTSNDYTIIGNTNATVTDGGTGTRKHVQEVSTSGNKKSETIHFSYQLSTASGTTDVTGFGFNPKSVAITYGIDGGTLHGAGFASVSGTQSNTSTHTDSAVLIARSANFVLARDAANTASQTGNATFIADGIKITWTKVGSPTGTLGITIQGYV
jgi:hypothetical protein